MLLLRLATMLLFVYLKKLSSGSRLKIYAKIGNHVFANARKIHSISKSCIMPITKFYMKYRKANDDLQFDERFEMFSKLNFCFKTSYTVLLK